MNKLLDEKFHILYKELEVYDLPSNFPECYHSESLKRDFNYSNIAINNGKHILLLAKKVQDLFKQQNEYQTFSLKEKINQRILSLFSQKKQQLLIYYEDLYLAGDNTNSLISQRDGPLTNINATGNSGVFDNLNAAQLK